MKKHQKMIATFVVFAFLSLLQISAMPQADEQSPGQAGTSMSSPDEAPNFIEEEGNSGYQPKKKSMLPIILGVVALGAVVAVLVLVVLKTKYDIRGTWSVTATWTGQPQQPAFNLVFTGSSRDSGVFSEGGFTGTWTADGKDVSWKYNAFSITATGKFTGKDTIEGTTSWPPEVGTFKAVRTASATGIGNSAPCGTAKETK